MSREIVGYDLNVFVETKDRAYAHDWFDRMLDTCPCKNSKFRRLLRRAVGRDPYGACPVAWVGGITPVYDDDPMFAEGNDDL